MNKKTRDLNGLTIEQLYEQEILVRKELFQIRMSSVTEPLRDSSKPKKLKKTLARVLTLIRERELSVHN